MLSRHRPGGLRARHRLGACPIFLILVFVAHAADYRVAEVGKVLPGGRLLSPYGEQFVTGPGPFGLAISPDGKRVVTANSGPDYFSLSFLEANGIRNVSAVKRDDNGKGDDDEWHSSFMGLAFESPGVLYAADGESGRVRAIDPQSGRTLHVM